jgi:K+-sensing histidine kinase KdpD
MQVKYEAGHGLTDAVRYQKQLKRDLQRAQSELEQRSQALGEALDAREVLQLMCQRLKKEAGRAADFVYFDLPVIRATTSGSSAGQVCAVCSVHTNYTVSPTTV